jgi:K+-transporting ATPase ATPase C chain
METMLVALRATLVTLVLTGIAYPLAITGAAQLIFPHRANGSFVADVHGREVGSELIGQTFADPAYFHGRPSNAGSGYDAASSGGTNLGTTSKKLRDGAAALADAYRKENRLGPAVEIPADAVTSSASGLDPHISPDNARLQAARIAHARGDIAVDRVLELIDDHVEGRELGFLGEPRVNVLATNLALDQMFGLPSKVAADGATPSM